MFAFFAFPVGVRARRSGRTVGFAVGLFVAIVYWGLLIAGQTFGVRMSLSPALLHVVSGRGGARGGRGLLPGEGATMRLLRRMLLRQFLPIFVVALVFFVLLLQLIDIFGNIWRYFAHDVTVRQVAWIALLYLPKCISFALPVSFLFAISYTLGLFYANNELFAIFGSGVSLHRLVTPFLVLGVLAQRRAASSSRTTVVIPTFQAKNEAYAQAVKQVTSLSQSNVTVTSPDQRVVYVADYYNDAQKRLTAVTVVIRDAQMDLVSRIDAQWAEWQDGRWVLHDCRMFTWDPSTTLLSADNEDRLRFPAPRTSRRPRSEGSRATSRR